MKSKGTTFKNLNRKTQVIRTCLTNCKRLASQNRVIAKGQAKSKVLRRQNVMHRISF